LQKAFHLELDLCTGCNACAIACEIENEIEDGMSWRRVQTFNEARIPELPQFHLSLACNHCLDAPCEENCPALAYDKDPVTGAVTIDPERCIGCKYCSWACPYDAPQFSPSQGIMQKCTFCSHRLAADLSPACTTSCPTGALRFGDFEPERTPAPVPGFYRDHIEPAIHIKPLRRFGPPAFAGGHVAHANAGTGPVNAGATMTRKISLRSEWSLLVFTTIVPILVALVASASAPLLLVPVLGLIAMGLSAAHLGKPARAYRAILNWRRSWLSREILLFPAFVGLSLLPSARPLTAAVGFATLLAMDQVYRLSTNRRRGELHSAAVLLTGLFLTGVFAQWLWLVVPVWLLKLGLYLRRHHRYPIESKPLFFSRIAFGFVLPVAAFTLYPLAIAFVLVGELIDRVEFYLELDFAQPSTQMRADLERAMV
jgi:DMSO reductase iron-sulfur subunit